MPAITAHQQAAAAADGREYKSFGAPVLNMPEDQPGTIEAIVAVFNNIDAGNDRIRPGFFAKSIARKKPPGVWGHDWLNTVAKTLEAKELHPGDPMLPPGLMELGGLYIKGQFNLATQRGREAYEDIKFGIVDEFSIGFITVESETDKKTGVRDLIEGDVLEWSPVLVGMNSRTRLLSVKSADRADAHESTKSAKAEKASRKARPVTRRTLFDHSRDVVTAIGEIKKRVEDRAEFRSVVPRHADENKAGAMFSRQNRTALEAVSASCKETAAAIDDILARDERSKPADESASAAKAEDAASVEVAAVEPAAGAATPAVPTVAEPAPPDEPSAPPAASPDTSAAVLAEFARFEAIRAASLGVPVGS